jgi:hypothetical protein
MVESSALAVSSEPSREQDVAEFFQKDIKLKVKSIWPTTCLQTPRGSEMETLLLCKDMESAAQKSEMHVRVVGYSSSAVEGLNVGDIFRIVGTVRIRSAGLPRRSDDIVIIVQEGDAEILVCDDFSRARAILERLTAAKSRALVWTGKVPFHAV